MTPPFYPPPSPHTPLIANKRQRSPRHHQEPPVHVDCLQQSLKKVRLSSSPGELRLQKDLRHLVMHCNWRIWDPEQEEPSGAYSRRGTNSIIDGDTRKPCPVSLRSSLATSSDGTPLHKNSSINQPYPPLVYQAPPYLGEDIRLWVDDTDPLQLILCLPHQVRVHIHIPPLYPHRPPVVQQVRNHPRIQHVVVLGGGECPTSGMPSQTLVFDQWSAICRIDQFIDYLCQRLTNMNKYTSRMTEKSWNLEMSGQEAHRGREPHLPPNRFDLGYEKLGPLGLFMDES